MVKDKEYIVSLNMSLTTPRGVTATSESEALKKAKAELAKLFSEFEKKLDGAIDVEIEVDYVELDYDEGDEDDD